MGAQLATYRFVSDEELNKRKAIRDVEKYLERSYIGYWGFLRGSPISHLSSANVIIKLPHNRFTSDLTILEGEEVYANYEGTIPIVGHIQSDGTDSYFYCPVFSAINRRLSFIDEELAAMREKQRTEALDLVKTQIERGQYFDEFGSLIRIYGLPFDYEFLQSTNTNTIRDISLLGTYKCKAYLTNECYHRKGLIADLSFE